MKEIMTYPYYEFLVGLRTVRMIDIKRAGFFQLRLTVFQQEKSKISSFRPILLLHPEEHEEGDSTRRSENEGNQSEIDEENSVFYSRKFLLRNIDQVVTLNELCIFKGNLLYDDRSTSFNKQIFVHCELLSFQHDEIEIVDEWEGHTRFDHTTTCTSIYLSSYNYSVSVNTSFHCALMKAELKTNAPEKMEEFLERQKGTNQKIYDEIFSLPRKHYEELRSSVKNLLTFSSKDSIRDWQEDVVKNGYFVKDFDCIRKKESFPSEFSSKKEYDKVMIRIYQKLETIGRKDLAHQIIEDMNSLNEKLYQLWKNYLSLILKNQKSLYFISLEKHLNQQVNSYQLTNEIIIGDPPNPKSHKPQENSQQLKFYPFVPHLTQFKISKADYQKLCRSRQQPKVAHKHLIILVHGYQASSYDMDPISKYLQYKYPMVEMMISSINEGRTEQMIEDSGHRLAIEIKNYINSQHQKNYKISFVCHSLGGIIVRACLKYLQLYKTQFNAFISLCSPHIGYLYHSSTLVTTSLWVLNKIKKEPSMLELTMTDHKQLQKTYLYDLSKRQELTWFNKVVLVGSQEDEYVPFWSALLHDKDFFFKTEYANTYKTLYENLASGLQDKIIRVEMVFNDKVKDLSAFIGRTAHIKILNHTPSIQLFSILVGKLLSID